MFGPPSTPTRSEDPGGCTAPEALSASSASTDIALARGVLYNTLALGFHRPDAATLDRLGHPTAATALAAAAQLLDQAADTGDTLAAIVHAVLARRPQEVADGARRYDALFGHTVRGRVCLYETEYGPDHLFQQPHALADLAGFYRAFGFAVRRSPAERPDHVGCECEFMALLCLKEAALTDAAWRSAGAGDDDAEETRAATRAAERRFLKDHLGRMAPALAAALAREDPDGFYGELGRLLGRLVEDDARRLGVATGPATLALRPVIEDDTPMACGASGSELIQIQGLGRQKCPR